MQFKATTNNQYDCYPVGAYLPNYAKDIGKVGDIYIDVSDWTYYIKASSGAKGWIISGGINNPNRMTGLSSENAKESALFAKGAPTNIGEDNNVYIDMNTLDYYKKDSGSWIKLGTLLLDGVNKDGSVFTCYRGPEEHDRAIYHNSSFTMNITIYTKESSKIVGHSYTSEIVLDNYSTNDGDAYRFFAFSLQDYSLSRMVGFSVTFDNLNDDLVEWNKNKTIDGKAVPSIDYALFIYEVFLPYTYWH